jgi:PqqD family protein of HPr-rel-A system
LGPPVVDGVWRRNPRRRLFWRDWGGDSVVFEERSGHTYQFAPLAAAVMAGFEEHATTFDALARSIAETLGTTDDNELRAALVPVIEQFRDLGWIEPID